MTHETPFRFDVCPLGEVERCVGVLGATHLLSLVNPGMAMGTPASIAAGNHLVLRFEDVTDPDLATAPTRRDLEQILAFGRGLKADDAVVIHCVAGRCRSPAALFVLLVQAMGVDRQELALELLQRCRPLALPNPLMVAYADEILGAEDRLFDLIVDRFHAA